jgi:hypothetical protein
MGNCEERVIITWCQYNFVEQGEERAIVGAWEDFVEIPNQFI